MIAVAVVALAMGVFVGARAVVQYIVALDRVRYHAGMEGVGSWLNPLGHDKLREIDQMMDQMEKQWTITGDARLNEEMKARIDEYRRLSARLHRRMEYHAAMGASTDTSPASPGCPSNRIRRNHSRNG